MSIIVQSLEESVGFIPDTMAIFTSTAAQTSFMALSRGISWVLESNLIDSIRTNTDAMQVL